MRFCFVKIGLIARKPALLALLFRIWLKLPELKKEKMTSVSLSPLDMVELLFKERVKEKTGTPCTKGVPVFYLIITEQLLQGRPFRLVYSVQKLVTFLKNPMNKQMVNSTPILPSGIYCSGSCSCTLSAWIKRSFSGFAKGVVNCTEAFTRLPIN